MAIPIFLVAHWYLSLFSQTFYLHRYSAHKQFVMNKFWEKFFYLFTYITQGSSFLNPRAYAILHRMHHAYSDTEKDPHSPVYSGNIFTMMWKTRNIYNAVGEHKLMVPARFEGNYPTWKWLDKFNESGWSRIGWGGVYTLFYLYFATEWWMYMLLPIHYLMGPIHGAIVNWFGHKLGYRNFESRDQSRNTFTADVLMMGELFQNNHHHYPMRANFATKWWEFDPTYPVMKVLSWMRIIHLRSNNTPDTEFINDADQVKIVVTPRKPAPQTV
jgi:stearoyl-CoA desaturase (delta-9 desaturase)